MDGLPVLTPLQEAVADVRAHSTEVVAAASARAQPNGFVSIRDLRATAKQVGMEGPSYEAERDVFRAAGFGRFKTGGVLAEWQSLVSATNEAARFHHEPIDLVTVSRHSLAWCLADRPRSHPIASLARLARDIVTDDVHNEQSRPTYRQLVDGWRPLL